MDLGPCKSSTSAVWERAIKEAGERRLAVYTDGSRDSDGRVGGRWHASGDGAGSVAVGSIATVWDGEVAGIRQALMVAPDVDLLVLSDSTAALRAIKRAAEGWRGRSRDLVEVLDEGGRHSMRGLSTQFGWVKAHVGCNGGPSLVPSPKVLPEGRPILHSHNYTLTINNNYRTDHYCSRFSYYYKNQSSTMYINYKTMETRCPNLSSPITSIRIFMVFLVLLILFNKLSYYYYSIYIISIPRYMSSVTQYCLLLSLDNDKIIRIIIR